MRDLLPRDVARAVLDRVPQHRDSAAVIFDRPREGQVVFESIDWHHPRHERFFTSNRPFLLEISPLEACLTEDPIQVMFTGRCAEMRELFDQLRRRRGGVLCGVDRVRSIATSPSSTSSAPGARKEPRSRGWRSCGGFPRAEVMAMGDNLNDLQMLEFAGTPVLMGNALRRAEGARLAGDGYQRRAGVAAAIETFIFGGVIELRRSAPGSPAFSHQFRKGPARSFRLQAEEEMRAHSCQLTAEV